MNTDLPLLAQDIVMPLESQSQESQSQEHQSSPPSPVQQSRAPSVSMRSYSSSIIRDSAYKEAAIIRKGKGAPSKVIFYR